MRRRATIAFVLRSLPVSLLLLSLACQPESRSQQPVSKSEPEAEPLIVSEQPGPDPRVDASEDDPCDPLPKAGEPCPSHASYCVIDWGEPCGASTALWCREGVWELEQERNLCDDESP